MITKRKFCFLVIEGIARTFIDVLDILSADGDEISDGARMWLSQVIDGSPQDDSLLQIIDDYFLYTHVVLSCMVLRGALDKLQCPEEEYYKLVFRGLMNAMNVMTCSLSQEDAHRVHCLFDRNMDIEEAYRFIYDYVYDHSEETVVTEYVTRRLARSTHRG